MSNKIIYGLIGTGPWQKPMYDLLKKLSDAVLTVGPGENIFNSDFHVNSDVRDIDTIIKSIDDYGIKPKYFFTSQSDITLKTVDTLNSLFIKNYSQKEIINTFTNKFLIRLKNQGSGIIKNPIFYNIKLDNLSDFIKNNKDDIVIKPLSLQSSIGVRMINPRIDFDVEEYVKQMNILGVKEVIAEALIDGDEYTLEGYKSKGGFHKILAASKKKKNINFGIASELEYSKEYLEKVELINDDLEFLFNDYEYGPTHTEIIINPKGDFFLVETAIRGGGSGIASHIVPALTGFNPEIQMVKDATGIHVEEQKKIKYKRVALIFFGAKSKIFPKIFYDELGDNLIKIWTNYNQGEKVKAINDDRSRHGFVIIGSNSYNEQKEIINYFKRINMEITLYD